MTKIFEVCIPNSKRDSFSYLASIESADSPESLVVKDFDIKPGIRVEVPFRNSTKLGVVIGMLDTSIESLDFKLKPITKVIDKEPVLTSEMLKLLKWLSNYYQAPLSDILPYALPKKYRELRELSALNKLSELHELRVLKDATLRVKKQSTENFSHLVITEQKEIVLNTEQQNAVNNITANLDTFKTFLLLGVTGSGKTEVYLKVIDKVLLSNKQVLLLVPEIGLTPQLFARFRARFEQSDIVVLHSFLTDNERFHAFNAVVSAKAKIVVGTRSAIFAPFKNLGLIIVDEEHDSSFKQAEGVRYSARDVAIMRAFKLNIPIVLGSATPSLESYYNVAKNKYELLELKNRALTDKQLKYHIQDIRNLRLVSGISKPTLELIKTHLKNDHQVLVFVNKRGFSPVYLCHECGNASSCKACDVHVTYHQRLKKLKCHHCGLIYDIPLKCVKCNAEKLIAVGIGTERVCEYLQNKFSDIQVLKIDRDEIGKKHAFENCLLQIANKQARLIVGTQMLAKGHHFPDLTLVVVLDADYGFFSPDFRALENLGQLLTQVAGRAGRAQIAGEVLIQTHVPKHPLLNLLIQKGYNEFAHELLQERQNNGLPPYEFLAIIRARAKQKTKASKLLTICKEKLQNNVGIFLLGPADAPLSRKNNYYRLQLLVRAQSRTNLQQALTKLREYFILNQKLVSSVQWSIDVDPVDLS